MTEQSQPVSPTELSYEEAVAELESIVHDLDIGVINVDTLSDQFQRAIDIVEELDSRINRTRDKINALTPRLQAISEPTGSAESGE